MQNLKFGVLVCGLLGLVGCFLPLVSAEGMSISLFDMRKFDAANTFIIMGGFAAALAMGAMGAAKGMQRWQSIVAIVGFALIVIKMRSGFLDLITKGAIGAKLIGIAAVVGLVFAILTAIKPEPAKH
ncbi:MAG: hypothetical protein H0X17_01755 [Deltaproteobacteria bacterium]|nr:hypothetical protein [Deltaproteobacteria bacterium]